MASKSARTREHIIRSTAPVFNLKGYNGTSLSDLTEATGLTKGALYGNFDNKEVIALEAFRYSMEVTRAAATSYLSGKVSARSRLLAFFDFYVDNVMETPMPGGCPMMNNSVDADDHQTFLREAVVKEIRKTQQFIRREIEEGKRSNEFRQDTDARMIAQTFFCAIEGAIVISRVMGSREPMKQVIRYCQQVLNQISI